MFFFMPCLSFPWIHYYNSSLYSPSPALPSDDEMRSLDTPDGDVSTDPVLQSDFDVSVSTLNDVTDGMFNKKARHWHSDISYGSTLDHFYFFMTAPITKFYSGMVNSF